MDLANYMDNEYLMLDSYKLASDQILLLLSQQLVQIFEDIFEMRGPAGNTDISNRSTAVVRYAWATLQAHAVMASYREAKFRDHRSIAGTFIRFLTRNLVDQSAMGLSSTVSTLQNEVRRLQEDMKKRVTAETFNKLDAKVSALKTTPKKE
jgi:hydroxylamine reductase (hybrid-cluster protein)